MDSDSYVFYDARRIWFYGDKRSFGALEVTVNICVDKWKAVTEVMAMAPALIFAKAKEQIVDITTDQSEAMKKAYGVFVMYSVTISDVIPSMIINNDYKDAIRGISKFTVDTVMKMIDCIELMDNTKNRSAYCVLFIFAIAAELCMIMQLGTEYYYTTQFDDYIDGLYHILILLGKPGGIPFMEVDDLRDGVFNATATLLKCTHHMCMNASSFDEVAISMRKICASILMHKRLKT
jgi:hypothetical protein